MIKIPLTQGKVALIDDKDFKLISKYKWHYADYLNGRGYAKTANPNRKPFMLRMHRLILSAKPGDIVDHINQNTLDNRRKNLRIVTQSQNMVNMKPRRTNKSGYKGVCKVSHPAYHHRPWLATTWKNNKQVHIGYFATAKEAAIAYNKKVLQLHGEFAYLNKILL